MDIREAFQMYAGEISILGTVIAVLAFAYGIYWLGYSHGIKKAQKILRETTHSQKSDRAD